MGIEEVDFLGDGLFTRKDWEIIENSELIGSNLLDYPWKDISEYLQILENDDSKKQEEFRMRTASQILESEYENGCTDRALVFCALSREAGIPTRYVETLDAEWLKNKDFNRIKGHVFVDLLVNGKWKPYDPQRGFTKGYTLGSKNFKVLGRGLDFSELYLLENGVYWAEPINAQNIRETLRTIDLSKIK